MGQGRNANANHSSLAPFDRTSDCSRGRSLSRGLLLLFRSSPAIVVLVDILPDLPEAWCFGKPWDVAVDSSGNVYVLDYDKTRVQKFDPFGKELLATWGAPGWGDGEFHEFQGIAVDSSGNVYVADRAHRRVQKFDSSGDFLAKWGSAGEGDGEFDQPFGIAVDSSGNVYVSDYWNHRIQKFDSSGNFLDEWGSEGSEDGQFVNPCDVAVDSWGNVLAADADNHRVQKFSPAMAIRQSESGPFVIEWGSMPGKSYQVLLSADCLHWTPASGILSASDSGVNSWTDDRQQLLGTLGESQWRFYRVERLP